MMPTTVPSRPMYGASEPIVPTSQSPRRSSITTSSRAVWSTWFRSSSAMLRQRRPSPNTSAIGVFDASQSVRAAATSRRTRHSTSFRVRSRVLPSRPR